MVSTLTIDSGATLWLGNNTNLKINVSVDTLGLVRTVSDTDDCTITGDLSNVGICGHISHTGTVTVTGTVTGCGEYLGGWSSLEPASCSTSALGDTAYVTNEGLKVVTHRLLTNLINGHPLYSGKISKLRIYYDDDADGETDGYFDAMLNVSHNSVSDTPIPWSFGQKIDAELGVLYDTLTMDLNFIVPDYKWAYDTSTGTYSHLSSDVDVYKMEILNERDVVLVTTDTTTSSMFTIEYEKRYTFQWELVIGNDTAPPEWSNHSRSSWTQFGLFLLAHRLVYDDNNSPITAPPMGVYLNSYQDPYVISQYHDNVETYWYNGSTWDFVGGLATPINADDIVQFMADKKFSCLYLDRTLGSGDFTYTIKYWNGSAWVNLPSVSDGTRSFSQDGFIEFNMPWDWDTTTDPKSGTFTGYAIRIVVDSSATANASITGTTSYLFLSDVDTTDNSPRYIINMNPVNSSFIDEHSSLAQVYARFSGGEIGKNIDEDGYLVSGEGKLVRGISLTTKDAIKEKIVTPVSVTVTSANVSVNKLKISSSNPKPDIILMIYDTTTGDCVRIHPETIQVITYPTYYDIYGYFHFDTSHDYKIWYLPRVIDMSPEAPRDIRKVLGPVQTRSIPTYVKTGVVSKDWSIHTPEEIIDMLEDKVSFGPINDTLVWLRRWRVTGKRSWQQNLARNAITAPIRPLVEEVPVVDQYRSEYYPRELMMGGGYEEMEENKFIVRGPTTSYVYSFMSKDKFPVILMRFPTPRKLPGQSIMLQLALSMENSLHATGADVFIWQDGLKSWKPISRFDMAYGSTRQEMKNIVIDTDEEIIGENVDILVISQVPHFSKAVGLRVKSNVPDERLNLQYNEIYDTYNGDPKEPKDIADFVDISESRIKMQSIYARLISAGSSAGKPTELIKGIDYVWDDSSNEIQLQTVEDVLTQEQKYHRSVVGSRYILTPAIAWVTETFYDIGKLGTTNGKWNNDEDIEDDISSGNFNMEFALSKIPYPLLNSVQAVFSYGEDHIIPPQNIYISYQSDYEYSSEDDYRDNHIKRHANGHGCYVAGLNISTPITYANITDEDVVYCTISYPYLVPNYYVVEYLEDDDYGIVSRSLRGEDTFGTPTRISNRDVGYFGAQILSTWPREKEPNAEDN